MKDGDVLDPTAKDTVFSGVKGTIMIKFKKIRF